MKKPDRTMEGRQAGAAAVVHTQPRDSKVASSRTRTEQKVGPDREFRPLKDEIIKADKRGRLTVGDKASEKQFRVLINNDGQILLDPVVVIPEREAWLFKNPQALMSVLRGMEQSKAGETHDLGSFAEFMDEADDE